MADCAEPSQLEIPKLLLIRTTTSPKLK